MNISGNKGTDAGNYTAVVSLKDSGNYQWSDGSIGNVNLSWKINAKSVAVTWGGTTSFVYNGKEQGPTASADSGISGETINLTTTTAVNVGSYTSTASIASVTGGRGKTSNYKLTGNTKSFTINKKAIQKTSGNYSGDYDGQSHTITLVVNEPKSGCTIYYSTSTQLTSSNYSSGSTSKPSRSSSGSTTVYWYIHTTNTNYSDVSGSNTITINNEPPTISFSPNGDNVSLISGGYYCSVCKNTFNEEHYHCPTHSDYYSTTPGSCEEEDGECPGTYYIYREDDLGHEAVSGDNYGLCSRGNCRKYARYRIWSRCGKCLNTSVVSSCTEHLEDLKSFATGSCGRTIRCNKTLVNSSNIQSDYAIIRSTINITFTGTAGIKTIQYGWSTSSSSQPSSWSTYSSSTSKSVSKTVYGTSTYYLWVKITDNGGDITTYTSNAFNVTN